MLDPLQRNRVKELLKQGRKAKAIAAEMGGGVTPEDIYPVANQMRKDGELSKPTSGPGSGSKKITKPIKLKKGADEFDVAVVEEIVRVEGEIDRLGKLATAYDKTNPAFAEKVEKKIDDYTRLLTQLREFQQN